MAKKKTEKIDDAKTVKPNFSNAERLFLANTKAMGLLEKRIIAIEKRVEQLEPLMDNALDIIAITNEVKKQKQMIVDLNKRIDRLVDAISKSKRTKGL